MTPQQHKPAVIIRFASALRTMTQTLLVSLGLLAVAQAHGQIQTGTAVTSPDALTFSASGLNFGSHAASSQANTKRVYIHNPGRAAVTLTSAIVANDGGGDASAFALADQLCRGVGPLPARLLPGGSCYLSVRFLGSNAEVETGTLTITSDASTDPYVIALSGRRATAESTIATPSKSFVFPKQPVAVESNPQVFRFFATGKQPTTLGAAKATGEFAVAEDRCAGNTLKPAQRKSSADSCFVTVRFKPTVSGIRTGSLTVPAAGADAQVVHLMGTAAPASGTLAPQPAEYNFYPTPEGTTFSGLTGPSGVYFQNTGSTPVTINSVAITGDFAITPSQDYSACTDGLTLSPGQTLSPGSFCTVGLTFSPTQSSGTDTGSLVVASTAGNVTVPLAGRALPSTQVTRMIPEVYDFGPVLLGTTAGTDDQSDVSVSNTGTVDTQISPFTLSGPNAADFSLQYGIISTGVEEDLTEERFVCAANAPTYIGPNLNCVVAVLFTPSKTGPESATLTVTAVDGTRSVTLKGTGVTQKPAATLSPTVSVFDTLGQGNALGIRPVIAIPVTFTNTGTQAITLVSIKNGRGASDFSGGYDFPPMVLQPGDYTITPVYFTAAGPGYRTGTLVFTDQNNHSYTEQLAAYAGNIFDSATLDTSLIVFQPQSIHSTTYQLANDALENTGSTVLVGGSPVGKNVVTGPKTTGDFVLGGYNCNDLTYPISPYYGFCSFSVTFQPHTVGVRRGTLDIPIRYADGRTETATVSLIGRALP